MVFKPLTTFGIIPTVFENDVKMYGIQTPRFANVSTIPFENDVKMYGIQTFILSRIWFIKFENDVKMYGIQT